MAESADVKKEAAASTAANATLAQIRSFAAGGVGGVCAVVVGHPFDLVKVRLQTAQPGVYKGAVDVVRRTVAREGLLRVSISCLIFYRLSTDVCRACMPASLHRSSASPRCVRPRNPFLNLLSDEHC